MKYKWKRDLPFAKAGTEISIGKSNKTDSCFYFHRKSLFMDDDTFEFLLSGGWIEEVKPREIWVNFYGDSYFIHNTENDAKKYSGIKCKETVKFIEAME